MGVSMKLNNVHTSNNLWIVYHLSNCCIFLCFLINNTIYCLYCGLLSYITFWHRLYRWCVRIYVSVYRVFPLSSQFRVDQWAFSLLNKPLNGNCTQKHLASSRTWACAINNGKKSAVSAAITIPFGAITILFMALIAAIGSGLLLRVHVGPQPPGPRRYKLQCVVNEVNLPRLHRAGEAAEVRLYWAFLELPWP